MNEAMLKVFKEDLKKQLKELKGLVGSKSDEKAQHVLNKIVAAAKLNKLDDFVQAISAPVELLDAVKYLSEFLGEDTAVEESSQLSPAIDVSIVELFLADLEAHTEKINEGLLKVERGEGGEQVYDSLMRSAHSIKGASSMIDLSTLSKLAHTMEDTFIKLKSSPSEMNTALMNGLFGAADLFNSLSKYKPSEFKTKSLEVESKIKQAIDRIENPDNSFSKPEVVAEVKSEQNGGERVLRVSSSSLNRLMGMAGESMVESLWLEPFSEQLLSLKHSIGNLTKEIDELREALRIDKAQPRIYDSVTRVQHGASDIKKELDDRQNELDKFIRRHTSLSERLYGEVIDIRMRPFEEGIRGFPRYVRDLAQKLGKKVRLEIKGLLTPVDRDILEKLESPLQHIIRNSIDHGIETPEERIQAGKDEEGVITVEAMHRAGMLHISVSDDGRGVDIEKIRAKIPEEGHINASVAENLTNSEVLEFLFLPGFTTSNKVTEISGRGVGLNVLQKMVQQVGGRIQTTTEKGKHLTFLMQLPLTLSVIRALLVEIAGEPYAFPLARIEKALNVARKGVETIESTEYFNYGSDNVGLLPAWQVLGLEDCALESNLIPVVMLNDNFNNYGIVVDGFIGEKDIVVHELDAQLGKVPGVSSGGFMEDGRPLLILDIDDMISSVDKLLHGGGVHSVRTHEQYVVQELNKQRVLVVDDSVTVREVQCRLLQSHGFEVQTAIDGMDGWNAVRINNFDLVITDVDMPRMNGIELVKNIKADPRLHNIPIMVVSYKDQETDRKAGIEAGADYYLTKSSFQDETLIEAAKDLLGRKV